jgi:outer membrane protein TolC
MSDDGQQRAEYSTGLAPSSSRTDWTATDGDRLDLRQVLALAEARGLDLELARARTDLASALAQTARAAWVPELSLSAETWNNEGFVQATGGNFMDVIKRNARSGLSVGLELDLSEAFFAPRAADERFAAQRALADAARQITRQRAVLLFLDLVEAQMERAIALEARTHAEELELVEGARFQSGAGLEVNFLRAQAHTAEVNGMVIEAERGQAVASARLAQHLDLDPTRGWEAEPPSALGEWAQAEGDLDVTDSQDDDESLVARAERQRPELAAARAGVRAAHLESRREGMRWQLPTLEASLFEGEFGSDFGTGSSSRVAAAGLTWNLSLGLVGQSRAARARERTAIAELAILRRTVQAQVVQAQALLAATKGRHEQARAQFAASQAGARLARNRHVAGAGLLLEALAAESELVRARSAVATAQVDRMRATWVLARALGQDL